jgi:hypothetical protein
VNRLDEHGHILPLPENTAGKTSASASTTLLARGIALSVLGERTLEQSAALLSRSLYVFIGVFAMGRGKEMTYELHAASHTRGISRMRQH